MRRANLYSCCHCPSIPSTSAPQDTTADSSVDIHDAVAAAKGAGADALRQVKEMGPEATARAQGLLRDKVALAKDALLAFLTGYREGKEEEARRGDAAASDADVTPGTTPAAAELRGLAAAAAERRMEARASAGGASAGSSPTQGNSSAPL